MDSCKTRGIITRYANYGEANCILTVMTEDLGLISACAYGVRSKKSKLGAKPCQLAFCEFVLTKKGGDIYRIESLSVIEAFFKISEDLTKLALANYICETASEAYSQGDTEILSLVLNTLYVLSYKDVSTRLVKAVYELKLMQFEGYEPELGACASCSAADIAFFDFSGGVVCESCADAASMRLSAGLLSALKYIFSADTKKIFSFNVSNEAEDKLSILAEGYFLNKREKRYKSLEYLKKIM